MRTNLLYYVLYCCLRLDYYTALISYPYYAKSTKVGEITFFRYIDYNSKRLVEEGIRANIIQGSLSLSNKNVNNYTIIIPRIHY